MLAKSMAYYDVAWHENIIIWKNIKHIKHVSLFGK